jgi:hypothetical protein
MKLVCGDYCLSFAEGGVEIQKAGKLLYTNKRPMFVTAKTALAASEFYDGAYAKIALSEGKIIAEGSLALPSGSEFSFFDTYEAIAEGFKTSRNVKVLKAGDDLGFSTKISFAMTESDDPHDYNCFAPGVWYRQNEFAPDYIMGKDLDCEYFWRMETCMALPLFAMQNIASGETAALSRWAADMTMRSVDIMLSENCVDPKMTAGALGMSRPESRTLNYTYYGFAVRKEIDTQTGGLSIDYVYPGCDGEIPGRNHFDGLDFKGKFRSFQRVNHPVETGFEQNYSVAVNFGRYGSFQRMMRDLWRGTYDRLRDDLFVVDNALYFHNCMKMLDRYTHRYGDSFGLPFACQLPDMDVNCVSFQFGFVGQQPGIGYQLLRYGDKEGLPETFEKGVHVIDFWVKTAMTGSGLPQMCYNPIIQGFEPYPHYIRMLADGVEAILDSYVYLHRKSDDRPAWLEFCRKTADWAVSVQNEDGSFFRAYNTDGSIRMGSKSNTPSVIRFLVQLYLVTGDERYKTSAIKAGEWSFENAYRNMEYRGGTCDNADIQDKEAGIYALFGFLALYDLTGLDRNLDLRMEVPRAHPLAEAPLQSVFHQRSEHHHNRRRSRRVHGCLRLCVLQAVRDYGRPPLPRFR